MVPRNKPSTSLEIYFVLPISFSGHGNGDISLTFIVQGV